MSETPEDRNFGVFMDIKIGAEADPAVAELVADLEKNLLRYNRAKASFLGAKLKWESEGNTPASRQDFEAADRSQRAAHEALISGLNIVSRAFGKSGLDNSWRGKIGNDRNQIAAWALTVGDHLVADTLKEHGFET